MLIATRASAQLRIGPDEVRLDSLARSHPCPADAPPLVRRRGDYALSRRHGCAVLALAWAAVRASGIQYRRASITVLRGRNGLTGETGWYWAVCFEPSAGKTDHFAYVDAETDRVRQADVPKRCGEPPQH